MNGEANDASENWEKLFEELKEYKCTCNTPVLNVKLTDSDEDRYDFANEILMRMMRERLVETLQRMARTAIFIAFKLSFGNKFFTTMNEQQQQTFFHSIFNLPVRSITIGEETDDTKESPAITIRTSALLETLPQLHTNVESLVVSNFALTRKSDVQALSNIILSKRETLKTLELESIECPDDDSHKENSDEPNGFLDPLLYAASNLLIFCVSTKTGSVHPTLVSPTALRALFVEGKDIERLELRLCGMGLTDNHVLAIVDGLSTPDIYLGYLNLESNPGITAQGYGALFDLINRVNVIDHYFYGVWIAFCVDDKAWEGKLNLVSQMNSEYSRLEYLTNGTFTSEERRFQWLERVVNLPISDYEEEVWDEKNLNFIWYTLRENPEMMQVFQAPTRMTRTKKRKAT